MIWYNMPPVTPNDRIVIDDEFSFKGFSKRQAPKPEAKHEPEPDADDKEPIDE